MWLRPTLRRKILFGFLLVSFCLGALALFSYYTLERIEEKVRSLEVIDDMTGSILEFRRQERQYLLYGDAAASALALNGVDATLSLFARLDYLSIAPANRILLAGLHADMVSYRKLFARMQAAISQGEPGGEELREQVREAGNSLVDQTTALSKQKRAGIIESSNSLRMQLLAGVCGGSFLLIFMFYGLTRHVMQPLRIIERATASIAKGNFRPFDTEGKADDEIRQVQDAFNRMLRELKSRHDQLVQTQKLSSIGTLSAGIAHQVNNPLNNISTSAQLLRGALPENSAALALKMLDNIDKETIRARDIVRSLLDFSRRSELTLRRVSLRSVVDTAVRLVSSQAPSGVALTVDVPPDIMLNLDPQRMAEALINLMLNAIEAIEKTPGCIRLSLDQGPESGTVTLVVEDSGRGIAPEDLPHIFDPFFTRKEVGEGTGLGLSVVYGIIEECGGSVRVESRPGAGTRFFLDLPLAGGAVTGGGHTG